MCLYLHVLSTVVEYLCRNRHIAAGHCLKPTPPRWNKMRRLLIFDTGVWPFQVGSSNSQTPISAHFSLGRNGPTPLPWALRDCSPHVWQFQFGGEMVKHLCLVHSKIVHPMSGHFKFIKMARHPCLLMWGVWPFRFSGSRLCIAASSPAIHGGHSSISPMLSAMRTSLTSEAPSSPTLCMAKQERART